MNTITINISRLEHLLKLYRLSKEDILLQLNRYRKKLLTENDIFKSEIQLGHLKALDSIFNKGINYYLDPKVLTESKEESIFFRKDKFNAELSLGAKQRVAQFEEEKIALNSLAKLSNLDLRRKLRVYTTADNPQDTAIEIRKILFPGKKKSIKDFLKAFINNLSEQNVIVYEFVDSNNKKEKANINGFFLSPNIIVLKRIQNSLRREIFTLAHELGHYLLNAEEIDEIYEDFNENASLSEIEKWCNDFAYYFLSGEYDKIISSISDINSQTDYQDEYITSLTFEIPLSKIAIYTRLVVTKRISQQTYNIVRDRIHQAYLEYEEEQQRKKERDKELGIKQEGRNPIPIISPLVKRTLQSALFEGVINEAEFCKRLKINPEKIENYLQ
jgi:Zn-dependent peptidase ImmA (M78 family)